MSAGLAEPPGVATAVAAVVVMVVAGCEADGEDDDDHEDDGHDDISHMGLVMGPSGEAGSPAVGQEGPDEPGDAGEEADAEEPPVQVAAAAVAAGILQAGKELGEGCGPAIPLQACPPSGPGPP